MKRIIPFLLLLLAIPASLSAQTEGVSINRTGADPDSSAILDIQSSTKGLLIPRMDSSSRIAISNPAEGLMVYDSTTQSFWYYQQAWQELGENIPAEVRDADGDTYVQVEATADEDNIRLGVKGKEVVTIDNAEMNARTNFFAGRSFAASSSRILNFRPVNSITSNPNLSPGWQSFTALARGKLDVIQLYFTRGSTSNYTISFYEGEGIGGKLLSSTNISSPNTDSWNQISFPDEVILNEGATYTIGFSAVRAIGFVLGNLYLEGRSNANPNRDFFLRVNIFAEDYGLNVVSDKVGIGTGTPAHTLEVVGEVQVSSLSGVGARIVVADSAGKLATQPLPDSTLTLLQDADNDTRIQAEANPDEDIIRFSVANSEAFQLSPWGLLSEGTFQSNYSGPLPASGAGIRMMWVPQKAAFRVGEVDGTQWNLSHIGDYSAVVGGFNNRASGNDAFVGGGADNIASNSTSFVGGGSNNSASGFQSFVGGGSSNRASDLRAFVGGGFNNVASNNESVTIGGFDNTVSGARSFIGGGSGNTASGWYAFVGGGQSNTASSFGETVFGLYSETYSPTSATSFDSTDRLFVIGNGTGTTNRSNALTILKSGWVGIGTSTPTRGKVEIAGSVDHQISSSIRALLPGGIFNLPSGNPSAVPYSLYATDRIASSGFFAHSDARIKTIQGLSNSSEDLNTLMQIEVTDYRMKDSLTKGNTPYKKVIAQQVAEVYPQAVTADLTEVVPDIYQRAEVQDGWIMLPTDLQVGERVKVITEQHSEVHEVTAVEADRFQVSSLKTGNRELLSEAKSRKAGKTVFIYGREVTDFHTVDYEAISMLNVSATQAQQRKIEELKKEVRQLKEENANIKASFEARLKVIEEGLLGVGISRPK